MSKADLLVALASADNWFQLAAFLVLLGTLGGFIFGHRISSLSKQLHVIEGDEQRQLQKDVAASNRAASEANERAAKANQAAEEAKLELVKFKAPRTLTEDQKDRIRTKLRDFPKQKFAFYIFPDEESTKLAKVIRRLLEDDSWEIVPSKSPIETDRAGMTTLTGIRVYMPPGQKPWALPSCNGLILLLNEEGIIANLDPYPSTPVSDVDVINISIGKKPY